MAGGGTDISGGIFVLNNVNGGGALVGDGILARRSSMATARGGTAAGGGAAAGRGTIPNGINLLKPPNSKIVDYDYIMNL